MSVKLKKDQTIVFTTGDMARYGIAGIFTALEDLTLHAVPSIKTPQEFKQLLLQLVAAGKLAKSEATVVFLGHEEQGFAPELDSRVADLSKTVDDEVSTTVMDLLDTADEDELDKLLRKASQTCHYDQELDVSWGYWHYGRHAEFAQQQGMPYMALLFSAAWDIAHKVHGQNDAQAREAARDEILADFPSLRSVG